MLRKRRRRKPRSKTCLTPNEVRAQLGLPPYPERGSEFDYLGRKAELRLLRDVVEGVNKLVANTESLTAAVAANTEATNAAVAKIGEGVTDQPAVDAATSQIAANTAALQSAVVPPEQPAA